MKKAIAKYLFKRGEIYYIRRPIPPEMYFKFQNKKEYVRSLETKDINQALAKISELNAKLDKIFDGSGTFDDPKKISDEMARQHANFLKLTPLQSQGPDDLRNSKVAQSQLVRNIELIAANGKPSALDVRALELVLAPKVNFGEVLVWYKGYTRDLFTAKDGPRTQAKYYNKFQLAVKNFNNLHPNINLLKLSKKQVEEFRQELMSQVAIGQIQPDTANRKISNLRTMFRDYMAVNYSELDLRNPFEGVQIKDQVTNKREPFTEEEIEIIKAKLASGTHNEELVAFNMISMHTGASCKELCLLTEKDIFLNAEIPYIAIRPNDLRNKVKSGGKRHRD